MGYNRLASSNGHGEPHSDGTYNRLIPEELPIPSSCYGRPKPAPAPRLKTGELVQVILDRLSKLEKEKE